MSTSSAASPIASLLSAPQEDQALATAKRHGRLVLIVFSGDFDKWMAAFSLATTAAAMGIEVRMFFAFWGLLGLRRAKRYSGKPWLDKLLTLMLPAGAGARVSRLNFCGLGAPFFAHVMRKKNVTGLPEMIDLAKQLGVRLVACQMSMATMGVGEDELVDGLEYGGASRAVADLQGDASTLFI